MLKNLEERKRAAVLGASIDALDWPTAIGRLVLWGAERAPRYVCICNVHSVVTASKDAAFMEVINRADMSTPDGMPIAWMLSALLHEEQLRINGPDLMWRYLAEAEINGQVVSFYGSTEATLAKLESAMLAAYPRLRIGVMISPPFRTLTAVEELAYAAAINGAGTAVLFVGLGCPKQELWMANATKRINAVSVGVGAAFDYHAGTIQRAPVWMQRWGLEWLHRLASEPRRLWKRYLVTNTIFIVSATRQLLSRPR